MKDQLGREITYMRISITDRCDLRCRYCMPHDLKIGDMSEILTFEEIARVVEASVSYGITDFRITGGEPLARRGCVDLVRMIKDIPGVRSVRMTTNATQLASNAQALAYAGIDGLNISLDTIDREAFRELTGRDRLNDVLAGIEAALELGIPVKLNCVTLPETDPVAMVRFAEEKQVPIRFIEMMPIGYGADFVGRSNAELLRELEQEYGDACAEDVGDDIPHYPAGMKASGVAQDRSGPVPVGGRDAFIFPASSGPARYVRFPELSIPVGFISALSNKFCDRCNRVRLTAQGMLKTCLCYDAGVDLRAVLRNGSKVGLRDAIRDAIRSKPAQHHFEAAEEITEQHGMSQIGG